MTDFDKAIQNLRAMANARLPGQVFVYVAASDLFLLLEEYDRAEARIDDFLSDDS